MGRNRKTYTDELYNLNPKKLDAFFIILSEKGPKKYQNGLSRLQFGLRSHRNYDQSQNNPKKTAILRCNQKNQVNISCSPEVRESFFFIYDARASVFTSGHPGLKIPDGFLNGAAGRKLKSDCPSVRLLLQGVTASGLQPPHEPGYG